MADIELVIKIPKEDYKRGTVMASAIRNGIPLNKIKEEISKQSRMHMDGDLYIKVSECMQIIDKHSEGGV
jgi:hypothetical protein